MNMPAPAPIDPKSSIFVPGPSDASSPASFPVVLPQRRRSDQATSPRRHEDRPPQSERFTPLPTPAVVDHPGRVTIWNVPFDNVTLDQSIDRIEEMVRSRVPCFAITANLNYVMLHNQNPRVASITRDADLIVADGQPIVWRSRLTERVLPQRVAGSDMIFRIAQRASQRGWKLYLLGGEPGVAQVCADKLTAMYPGLQIAGVESPPFRPLDAAEQLAQDRRIQSSGADVLLVAMGQPKGELWIHQHYQRLGVPVSLQLGASFDFIAGTARRAPRWFQRTGTEWVYRMASDPRRLAPRYAANLSFLIRLLIADWKLHVTRWGMWPTH